MAKKQLNPLKLNGTELAKMCGVSRVTVNNWDKSGLDKNSDGRTYSVITVAQWLAGERQKKEGASNTLAETKSEIEKIKLENIRMDLLERKGKLIAIDDVMVEAEIIASSMKTYFEKLRDKLDGGVLSGKEAAEELETACELMTKSMDKAVGTAKRKSK